LFQRLQHASEGALSDPGLSGQVPGLLLAPDPQHEQDGERGPGQVLVREHLALHVVADHVGGAVDVRHCGHGGEVELPVPDAGTDVALGLHEVAGVAGGEATGHSTMVRGAVHLMNLRCRYSRLWNGCDAGAAAEEISASPSASAVLISLASSST